MIPPDEARPSDREAIEATAAAWLAQRDAEFSARDEEEFARWRAADPRHEAAVNRLEAVWASLQQLRDYRPEAKMHPDRDLLRGHVAVRRRRWVPVLATCALAASLAVAALWWSGRAHFGRKSAEPRYATTVDGYERVMLEDGSLVELNANTEVRVSFTPAERRVRLLKGEAHFTVAKNIARPFNVAVGGVTVRAVGTAFNVRLGEKQIEVLVTEGKVKIGESANPTDIAIPGVTPISTVLSANHRVFIPVTTDASSTAPSAAPSVEKVAPDAIRAALAWQGPQLVFVDTPLAEAAAQFNQRNAVQLVVADAELAALPIGGSFRAENIDGFVRLLASDNEIVVERPEPNRIVLRRAK
ncbi:MAG: FecR domain-containing protein [Opitutaceae bacterium]